MSTKASGRLQFSDNTVSNLINVFATNPVSDAEKRNTLFPPEKCSPKENNFWRDCYDVVQWGFVACCVVTLAAIAYDFSIREYVLYQLFVVFACIGICLLRYSPPEPEPDPEPDQGDIQLPAIFGDFRSNVRITVPPMTNDTEKYTQIRQSLPIYEYRDEILSAIDQHQVVVISGETGSGKTTQVPQYIMENCLDRHKGCRIICTQPRRLAATSMALRVSEERNDILGNSVGYQIRLDSQIEPTTNLIFTTSGFLLRCLTGSNPELVYKNITHLILDEVHEREKITDFLLIAIRDAIKANPHLKVILMSATLDSEQFCRYFDNCPVFNVPGRMFHVEIIHLGDVLMNTNYRTKEMITFINENQQKMLSLSPDFYKLKKFNLMAYQTTSRRLMISNSIDHELLQHVLMCIHTEKPLDGSILVFLPGYDDIMQQKRLIENRFYMKNYQLFVLHSRVNGNNNTEQKKVFERMPVGIRKIILSTNIAETSITINDVVYVIDAGKVKQLTYDPNTQSTCLMSADISKACAKQRAGRAGRIRNGFCYRLYSTEQYEAMDEYTLPEILRVALTEICLHAKVLAGNLSIEEFLLKALQPPPVKNIRQSIKLLQTINALDNKENITHLGIHLVDMPVDCQLGKMILYALMLRCLDPVVTIVSILSVNDLFMLPLGNEGEKICKIKKVFARYSLSDHQMLLNTYNEYSSLNKKKQNEFCQKNYISYSNMQMIQGVRRLIMRHLKTSKFVCENTERNINQLNENSLNWKVVKACLIAGLYPNVCHVSAMMRQLYSKLDAKLSPHMSSILCKRQEIGQIDRIIFDANAKWLIHGEKSRISRFTLIQNISVIPAIAVALFAGPVNLPTSSLNFRNNTNGALYIDDWIYFTMNKIDASLLFQLRQKFASMFVNFLRNPVSFEITNHEAAMLQVLIEVICEEDDIEPFVEAKIKAVAANE